MAIILRGATACSICGEVLAEGDAIVVTSAFIGDEAHPLWQYSDSGMHRRCFSEWRLRQDFIDAFNGFFEENYRGARRMHPDGSIEEVGPGESRHRRPRESDYVDPWACLSDDQERDRLDAELHREVGPGHVLFQSKVRALARRTDRDDVLFEVDDGPTVAVVHLTYAVESKPDWPATRLYASIQEFERTVMLEDRKQRLPE